MSDPDSVKYEQQRLETVLQQPRFVNDIVVI